MRCMSCGADIPPAFVYCLESNICGGCGGPIMDEKTKEFMNELADALQKMPNDPNGLAGWLLSNYRFQKMGDAKPVEKFHRKGNNIESSLPENAVNKDVRNLINKNNLLSSKYSKLANEINSLEDPYEDNEVEISNDEENKQAYLELKNQGLDPFGNTEQIDPAILKGLDMNPENVEDITKTLSQSSEGLKVLENDRIKKIKAQNAISNGGGSFKRV